jgi:hypothetical protein
MCQDFTFNHQLLIMNHFIIIRFQIVKLKMNFLINYFNCLKESFIQVKE